MPVGCHPNFFLPEQPWEWLPRAQPRVYASSCTICDSQQSLGMQLAALQHWGHRSKH